MNQSVVGTNDGQVVQNVPQTPSLGQLKEALRVLENTQYLFNTMKSKVVYACGEGHLLASDEGRRYLTKIIKSLEDEHCQIRDGYPRLQAALEVARVVNKLSALRNARKGAAAGGVAGAGQARGPSAAAEAAASAAPAAALQAHCRSVVEQMEAAVCEEMLAAGGAPLLQQRPAKRPRTGDAGVAPPAAPAAVSSASPSSPPVPGTASAASPPVPGAAGPPAAASPPATGSTLHKSLGNPSALLGVLLRIRSLDGSAAAMTGGPAPSLGGMKIHVLDDGGNALALPSALKEALEAAAQASSGGTAAAAGLRGSGTAGSPARLDASHLAQGAMRLGSATQVRMLLPGVFVANVLLEGPGNPSPLRVTVDCADKAFELDPWATPTTQVFRRISALATRVLTYYVKRAPLSAVPRALTSGTGGGAVAGAGGGTGVAALLPAEPSSPGAAALEDLLLWLLTCRDVFSKRCAATGRLMAWDPSVQYPVPPIFRTFKLPREELRLRAVDLSRVAAYHMHVAPVQQLGWAEDVPAEAVEGLAGSTSGAAAEAAYAAAARGPPAPMLAVPR